jgi:6,7-dimethyl-8-ribityllumazine synthase
VSGAIDYGAVALDGSDVRVAIVAARWNAAIVDQMIRGAQAALAQASVPASQIGLVRCPGAFELPSVAKRLIETKRWDAVVCLGCVIRGDTAHFELVAGECARGIAELGRRGEVPVIFGVLTTENAEQAERRADPQRDDKGREAALAALEMVAIYRAIGSPAGPAAPTGTG